MKNQKKAGLAVLLLAICGLSSSAQDTYNFTQFYFNPALLNSSMTGSDGRLAMYASFRKQWAGIEGAPTIGNFSIQTALPNKLNLGLNASNDKNGLLSTSGVLFTGGYSLPVAGGNFFRFGISVGAAWNKIDLNALKFSTAGDPVQASLLSSNFQVMGNVGFSFHSPTFHAGLSVPNIFEPAYLSSESFSVSKLNPFGTIIAHASNRFYFADNKNIFEPYLVYRYNQNSPSQIEVAGVVHLQNLVWLGGSYKQNFGISALAGFKLKGQTAIGYSYSLKNTGTNQLSAPSHEIHIGLLLGKHDKKIPVYSFVDTEKEKIHHKTPQQIAAEKKKHEADLAKKKEEEARKQEAAKAKQAEEAKELAKVTTTKTDSSAIKPIPTGGTRLKDSEIHIANVNVDSIHLAEQAHLKRLEDHAANPLEEHNEEGHPNAERHEFVKQGGHHAELGIGDYVIAGVFKMEGNAKKYSDGLLELGFKESDYGYLTEKNLWYVHIAQSNDLEIIRQHRDKFRKMKMFREAWLLSVHK
ncbi:MAG: PorP/SprF family type IX secretion system membrane protein [Bacteroidota bacterium]